MSLGGRNDPTQTPYTHPNLNYNGWAMKLVSYTGNKEVFRSPFMPRRANWFTGPCSTSNGMEITSTYGYNWFLGSDDSYLDPSPGVYFNQTPDGTRFNQPITSTAVDEPARTLMLQMAQTNSPFGNDFGCAYNTLEAPDWDNKVRFKAQHRQGSNISYTDGHVKFMIAQEADSAGTGYPACGGGPSHTIYIWPARKVWTYPYYPSSTGGLPVNPVIESCAQ